MKEIVVKSDHAWWTDSCCTLIVDGDKLLNVRWVRKRGEEVGEDGDENLINEILRVFELTGLGPSNLIVENGTIDEVYHFLYNRRLSKSLKFVRIGICGCNMGNCYAPINFDILDIDCKSYADVFSIFADIRSTDQLTNGWFYEYPDSVFLRLEIITKIPKIYCDSCYGNPVNPNINLDDNKVYVSVSYGR